MASKPSRPVSESEKMIYCLREIESRHDFLMNKVKTLENIVHDMFVNKVGYEIESTVVCWIKEWKKVKVDPENEQARFGFIKELDGLLLKIQDNLGENKRAQNRAGRRRKQDQQ